MEDLAINVGGSLLATFIVFIFGKWKGWWWKTKNESSVELATRVLKVLDGEAEEKTTKMIYATKQLGDSLVAFYKNKTPYNKDREKESLELLEQLLSLIKPFATELSAANPELDHLKRAIIAYQKGLEWRAQIVKHLCHPPNLPAMDPGHVRDQLLSENVLPNDLLNAARSEAALFLRGYGINWLTRRKYRKNIIKKHRAKFKESVDHEYRTVLRQTSLNKARS